MPANAEQMTAQFGIPGVLSFRENASGLVSAEITTPHAAATIYLQGAHLTHWAPANTGPVLFLSPQSGFVPAKAIRGGVPISFPWFATDTNPARFGGKPGPAHGFARTELWTLAFAAVAGEDVHLTFTLGPTARSRELGFDRFRLAYQVTIGQRLALRLTVANDAADRLGFEEAFHAYFAVADVRETPVSGLEATPYLDKIDGMEMKPASRVPLLCSGPTDRVYNGTEAACTLHDRGSSRHIAVEKTNSRTTVVFNPWKAMADLGADEWVRMLCVETANAGVDRVTLEPGETHTMAAEISVRTA